MKKRVTFSMKMLEKLKNDFDYRFVIDWEQGDFGFLEFNNNIRHYVTRADIRVNRIGPHLVAGDKHYTDTFLKHHGYPVVDGDIFYSEAYCRENKVDKGIDSALRYARTLSFPLVIKPNNGLHGNGVQKITNEKELKRGLLTLFENNEKVIVQKFVQGDDYRVVVYNGTCISAYRRVPLTVLGDGGSTIQELLDEKIHAYQDDERKITLEYDKIRLVLRRKKMTLTSIPDRGTLVRLLDNANLSAGGHAEDVSDIIHPAYKKLAINAAGDLGLRLAGVDFMIDTDISTEPADGHWRFLELNASPGFHNFSIIGNEQYQRIEDLFRQILSDIRDGKINP